MAFADDLNILVAGDDISDIEKRANIALETVRSWSVKNRMRVGLHKSKYLPFCVGGGDCRRIEDFGSGIELKYGADKVEECTQYKVLGVILDQALNFRPHLEELNNRIRSRIRALKCLVSQNWGPSCPSVRALFQGYIYSLIRYAWPIIYYYSCANGSRSYLTSIHLSMNECLRVITGLPISTPITFLYWKCATWDCDDLFLLTSVCLAERVMRLPDTTAHYIFNRARPNKKSIIGCIKSQLERIFPSGEYKRVPFLRSKHHNSLFNNITNLNILPDTLENDDDVEVVSHGKAYAGFVDGSVFEAQNYVCPENRSGAAYVIIDNAGGCADVTQLSTGRVQHPYGSESTGLAALSIDMAKRVVADGNEGCEVALFTDCQSRIRSLEKLKMKDLLDRDTTSAINGLCSVSHVTLGHVRGHAGIHYNEICDTNAKEAAALSANEPLHYAYSAVKTRMVHILTQNRIRVLLDKAIECPRGRIAQAAVFTKGFTSNNTMKLDIPRQDSIHVNRIEINHCPNVYPEPPWVPTENRSCQFCKGHGGATHFLITCKTLSHIREKTLGATPSIEHIISNPHDTASFIREAVNYCRANGIKTGEDGRNQNRQC